MKILRVLVACEFSGTVRRAFRERGHDAFSCDLLLPEDGMYGHHYQCDVLGLLGDGWDMMIAFPPCTHLCVSGARWFKDKQDEQKQAIEFFMALVNAPIPMIAIENPIGIMSTRYRKPDQIIQPFEYGEPFKKTTCLWLKHLPKLIPTRIMEERKQQCWLESPGPDRWKRRSRTYQGIANAIADQWSTCES